ncbi:MAG: MFS transporter [Verrucomicrobiota bacterium]|nr:MFS transporter [Verrucomicrobiota bacterium]
MTRLRRDLRAMLGDGLAFSLMVGLGETYIVAFALAIGMTEVWSGWVGSVPILIGAMIQLISPRAVRSLRSHKRWVVTCAAVQVFALWVLALSALMDTVSPVLIFAFAGLYWAGSLGTGPAWNTWVGTLVPKSIRPRFFATRSRFAQGAVMVGLVLGGLALQYSERFGIATVHVFPLLFFLAGVSRFASLLFLLRQTEPQPMPPGQREVVALELLRRFFKAEDGRLLMYMLVMQIAVQTSGPFFTPYMLGNLQLSYLHYLVLIGIAFIAKMVALQFLGSAVQKIGSYKVLVISGFGVIPLAVLWIFSDNLWYLLLLQIYSGVAWAGYELVTFLMLFERIPERERTSILTSFNFANAMALIMGALIGGFTLKLLGTDQRAYHILFILSSTMRVATLPILASLGSRDVRPRKIMLRILGVRPNTGSIDTPLVTSMRVSG